MLQGLCISRRLSVANFKHEDNISNVNSVLLSIDTQFNGAPCCKIRKCSVKNKTLGEGCIDHSCSSLPISSVPAVNKLWSDKLIKGPDLT